MKERYISNKVDYIMNRANPEKTAYRLEQERLASCVANNVAAFVYKLIKEQMK